MVSLSLADFREILRKRQNFLTARFFEAFRCNPPRWGGCRPTPAFWYYGTANIQRTAGNQPMSTASIIGVDLAKNIFQIHGATSDGIVLFRKKLSRPQFLRFMSEQPATTVAMEACAGAHYWARELSRFGHSAILIAPRYVKAFVKRQKNDMADAEAIVEAAQRPTMRFVAIKSTDQQARAIVFRTREQFIRQRTQLSNALRSHLYEFGFIAPQGICHLKRLETIVTDPSVSLPELVRTMCRELLDQIAQLTSRIDSMKKIIDELGKATGTAKQLQTMPGIGPITALAVETFAPSMDNFRSGRDFAAWLGLVPKQNSSGGKQRLGRTSKMGQHDIRRLLVIGAMSIILSVTRFGAPTSGWLKGLLARKTRMVAAVALANKMARCIWAMLTRNENYREPGMMAA